jgi:transcriptional regulator GlxA family with amidase domain
MLDHRAIFPTPRPPPDGVEPDLKVGFILSPRFSILPFAGFIDCLRHAADEADRSRQIYCRWSVIAPSLDPIRSSCGLDVVPRETFPDPGLFDYIVVVGGLLPWCLDHPPETFGYLRQCRAEGVSIVGLCTGSFIIAGAGLLGGRRCGVHFEHKHQLVELFPDVIPVSDEIYVSDGGIITCPGGTAAIDLAVALITEHCGKARAVKGLTSLLVDRHRATHHIPPRTHASLASCGNWRVEVAVSFMERNLSQPFGIGELARRMGTSQRELDRAFAKHVGKKPSLVWRTMRLAHGHWLLVNTSRTITQIAHECGFADAAHFCRWFKTTFGETPNSFRIRRREVAKPQTA